MKKMIISLIFMSTCFSCHNIGDNLSENSANKMARHDEIRKIMRNHWINSYETGDFYRWSAEERKEILSELDKMKKDYYYELSDPNILLTVPGPSWGIRGPLTLTQVERESLEEIRKGKRKDTPQLPFGFQNDNWIKLKSQYKDGDEFYSFASDEFSWRNFNGKAGYILIHNNEVIGGIVTVIN